MATATANPFTAPTTLVFDAHGGFYFTDPAYAKREGVQSGHVYYAFADGTGVKRLQYYFYFPNGIALNPDGSTLYVNESLTSRIWAIPIESPGVLAQVDAGARAFAPRDGWPNRGAADDGPAAGPARRPVPGRGRQPADCRPRLRDGLRPRARRRSPLPHRG